MQSNIKWNSTSGTNITTGRLIKSTIPTNQRNENAKVTFSQINTCDWEMKITNER